jgi:sensor histidine kinase regulating citrate/malate metabolism
MINDSKKTRTIVIFMFFCYFLIVTILSLYVAPEHTVYFISLGVVGFGFALVLILSMCKSYRKNLLGFTPSEIKMLYSEYKSLIEQLSEAVISVDNNFIIKTINDPFKKMFKLNSDDVGKDATEIFPDIDFKKIISSQKITQNKLVEIRGEKLLISSFPLFMDSDIIGATAIIRSRLEVDMLLDQISGYQKISKALREQKHEFQNKLHVILGLIKMKDYDMVSSYIMENIYTTNLTSDYFTSRIKDDKINALFVGKDIQSKEFDTQLQLTSDSNLSKSHEPISSDDLVIVLGNLIDNSFEAFNNKIIDNRKVVVKLYERDEDILIGVSDNAGGIDPELKDKIFRRGVSTKNGNSRGTGLSLVNEIVKMYNGSKQVQSNSTSTYIEIILRKVK